MAKTRHIPTIRIVSALPLNVWDKFIQHVELGKRTQYIADAVIQRMLEEGVTFD